MHTWFAFTMILTGCGQQYWSAAVRPEPKGEARVVLAAHDGVWIPIACYDPIWRRLKGPRDCADLIPPGALARGMVGGAVRLDARRPARCENNLAVGFPGAPTQGLAVWPFDAPSVQAGQIDLDEDGILEVLRSCL